MSSPSDGNIYEGSAPLTVERERLRNFDIPTMLSIDCVGPLRKGAVVLDIGSGENPGLREYTLSQHAAYVAFDIRHQSLAEQRTAGARAVQGDVRSLPFAPESTDIAHSRFVLAHFTDPAARHQVVNEAFDTVALGGKAVFIDYDWAAMSGSPAILSLRDFTLNNIKLFDASFGSYSGQEISKLLGDTAEIKEQRTTSPLLKDYGPVLALREITIAGLTRQGAGQELINEAGAIFVALEEEAASNNPPGFHMPDMVAVVASKSFAKK